MQNAELKSIGCGVAHCATYIYVCFAMQNTEFIIYSLLFVIYYLILLYGSETYGFRTSSSAYRIQPA